MKRIMKFKKYFNFVSESLAFLSLNKTMKNEFMNRIDLKQDFEDAKRIFYTNAHCILTHIQEDRFELRTNAPILKDELEKFINDKINTATKSIKFKISGKSKMDIIKERIWMLKANLE